MHVEIVFRGRVQGVGFRMTTQRLARDRGVVGWVRNNADGSVTLGAEGEKPLLDAFLDALRRRMRDCIEDERPTITEAHHGYTGFEIRR